jgi:hypothetical protein
MPYSQKVLNAIDAALSDINLLRLLVMVDDPVAANAILTAYRPALSLSPAEASEFVDILKNRKRCITAKELVECYNNLETTPGRFRGGNRPEWAT